jgi:putative ABC transport system permease protein
MARSNRSKRALPRTTIWISLLATMKLARWQIRQTRGLIAATGIGIAVAVVLICTVPLYAQVAISAGIHDALLATPEGPYVTVNSISEQISPSAISGIQQQLTQLFQRAMGPLISSQPELSVSASRLTLLTLPKAINFARINLLGYSMNQASPHLTLLKGQLPQNTYSPDDVDIAIPPQSARLLHVSVGSTLVVQAFNANLPQSQAYLRTITLHVTGIFTIPANDPFWHNEDFQFAEGVGTPPTFKALVSNDALLQTFNLNATDNSARGSLYNDGKLTYIANPQFDWYYPINVGSVNVSNLSRLVSGMSAALTSTSDNPVDAPYVEQTQASGPLAALQTYSNYVFVLLIPATGLTALLMGLILYFISVMTDLLVGRKAESVAILRSRGANRFQIFNVFVAQALALSIVALVVGPLLAIVAVRLLVTTTLSAADQGAINLLTVDAGQIALLLIEYAGLAAIIVLITMIFSIYRATRTDIVYLRREAARSTQMPLWQRGRLDLIAAFVALVVYGASIYLTNPSVLSSRVRELLLAPMTLFGAVFLLIAASLLFLRGFPLLLHLGSWLAMHGRGASPLLALAQMARAPQQAVRTIMLLAFATAFIIFALVFSASQGQRVRDAAAFQVGSDFSANISGLSGIVPSSTFSRLPGVAAASTGYSESENVVGLNNVSVELLAADARTFAQATIWTNQDSARSPALLAHLVATSSSASSYIPAIVDAAAWNALNLSIGSHFTLSDSNNQLIFVVIGRVQYIPTIIDTASNGTNDAVPAGGILVDFQTYTRFLEQASGVSYATSTVWVKAKPGTKVHAEVRHELLQATNSIPVNALEDRQAIASALQHDPLYIALLEILITGAITALLLALLGNLIAAWQNARRRLTSFSVLRALGSSPSQLARILLWEQSIVYAVSLLLGVLFGIFLSLLSLPSLIFTSAGGSATLTTGELYVIQSVPSIRVIIPVTVWIALAALILMCISAIWMMVRIVSRPSISQTLRLNED